MKQDVALEQYYSGDKAWNSFAEMAKKEVNSSNSNRDEKIISALNTKLKLNEDIAYVVYYFFQHDSESWIEKQAPVLDNLKPVECLDNKALLNRLREALLRMPW